ncbi:MAG: toll/interleukin-1 receptor domain-containing protein [Candidatus Binataceae bacterium]
MSEGKQRVFVSYTHKDAPLAHKLFKALSERGMEVWTDAKLATGASFRESVAKALRSASCYIVLVSDEALSSRSVNFEIGAALGQEKQLIPVFLTKHAHREAPPLLRKRVGVVAERMSADDIAEHVVKAIERAAA